MSFRAIFNVWYHACILLEFLRRPLYNHSLYIVVYERSKYRGYHHVIIEISLGPMATVERKKNRGRIMIIHFSTPYIGSGLAKSFRAQFDYKQPWAAKLSGSGQDQAYHYSLLSPLPYKKKHHGKWYRPNLTLNLSLWSCILIVLEFGGIRQNYFLFAFPPTSSFARWAKEKGTRTDVELRPTAYKKNI